MTSISVVTLDGTNGFKISGLAAGDNRLVRRLCW